jgi:capsular polysaccharide biosynthesis protein
LLVNGPLTAFQLESLRILGVGEDRLLPLEYPSSVSVRHLLYPSLCSSSFTPPHSFRPGVLAWLRESFAPLMRSERRERKIFISRGGEIDRHRRRLLNHEEIAGIAQKHDFDIVSPEKLSFIDQIKLFAGASVIAGAHGAGFANMIFAPKGTSLVELIGPRLSDSEWSMGYVRLAALAGQSVTRIVGQSDEREAIAFDHLPYETYTIDPKEFATVLDG